MKEFGYGSWEVDCPQCHETRTIRAHKYQDGSVRGSDNLCRSCMGKNYKRRVILKCPSCGLERELTLADSKQRLSAFCNKCSKPKGKPKYKNGRHVITTSRGYSMVLGLKHHPLANKARQIHEHWLVFYEESNINKDSILWFKKNGFTIHHKNGIRNDNRYENLELRAPGRHGAGWTIDEMKEVIRRHEGGKS